MPPKKTRFGPSPYSQPVKPIRYGAQQQQQDPDFSNMTAAQLREWRSRREGRFHNQLEVQAVVDAEQQQQQQQEAEQQPSDSFEPTLLHSLLDLVVNPLFRRGSRAATLLSEDDIQLLFWVLSHPAKPGQAHHKSEDAACDRLLETVTRVVMYCVSLDCAVENSVVGSDSENNSRNGSGQGEEEEEDQQKSDDDDDDVSSVATTTPLHDPPSPTRSAAGFRARFLVKQYGVSSAIAKLLEQSAVGLAPAIIAVPRVAIPISGRDKRDENDEKLFNFDAVCFLLQCASEMKYSRVPSLAASLFRCVSRSFTGDAVVFRGVVGELILLLCWISQRYELYLLAAACDALRLQRRVTLDDEDDDNAEQADGDAAAVSHVPLASLFDIAEERDAAFWLCSSTQQTAIPPAAVYLDLPNSSNSNNNASSSSALELHTALQNLRVELEKHRLLRQRIEPYSATDLVLSLQQNQGQRECFEATRKYLQCISDLGGVSSGKQQQQRIEAAKTVIRDLAEMAAVASLAAFPPFVLATKRGAAVPTTSRIAALLEEHAASMPSVSEPSSLQQLGVMADALSEASSENFAQLSAMWGTATQLGHDRHMAQRGEHQQIAQQTCETLGSGFSVSEFVRGALSRGKRGGSASAAAAESSGCVASASRCLAAVAREVTQRRNLTAATAARGKEEFTRIQQILDDAEQRVAALVESSRRNRVVASDRMGRLQRKEMRTAPPA